MSLKKLGIMLLAVFAVVAVVANSASAANEFKTTKGYWYVAGTKLLAGSTHAVALNVKGKSAKQTLETSIGGAKFDITATGVTCVSCVIDNTTAAESGNANDTATIMGKLKYSGVTVSEPGGCSTTTTIETKELTAELGMNTAGTKATLEFIPTAGSTTAFATIEISGASCALSGLYKVTGTIYGESVNATNVNAKVQSLTFSKGIQESAGTSTSLKFGENGAFLTGELEGELTSGKEWKGNES